ncbi:MAG: hypothetical protein IKP95_02475 [Ruminococcus sp.]|nr:hypothetical protein [Ruminococcus sp.]
MKAKMILAALLAGAMLLCGCGSTIKNRSEAQHVSLEDILPQKPAPADGTVKVDFGKITAEIPARWRVLERDGVTAYVDDETKCAYMLSFQGSDKELTEGKVLEQYMQNARGTLSIEEQLSDELTNSEGKHYRTAFLRCKSGENTAMLMFVFWHEQNYYVIFKGEASEGEGEELIPALREIAESATTPPDTPERVPDMLTGKKVTVTAMDSFTLDLTKKGKFVISQGDWKGTGYRIEGTARILRGKEALDELKKYESKFETLDIYDEWDKADGCGELLNYYAVILECETVRRWGAVTNSKSYTRIMTGVKNGPDTLSMYDHKEYIKQKWKIKE